MIVITWTESANASGSGVPKISNGGSYRNDDTNSGCDPFGSDIGEDRLDAGADRR